jgi:EmrB/QacA subfamily drug resistance transporter
MSRAAPGRLLDYKWIVLINTTIGLFMGALDSSIVTIALPDITHSLNATVVETMWVVMGYQLVITALMMPFSRLADMKGRVGPYKFGFAVFTISSALCGFAQTGTELVFFRLLQGIGSALLFANSTALVTDAFPGSQRGFALGINSMVGISGFILGTVLGGVITEFLGWRYIFFINIPFGLFATVWAFMQLHDIVEPEHKARFDIGGMLAFPLGIGSILAGLTFVVQGRTSDPITAGLLVVGAVLLVVFFLIERRVEYPMLDLSLFRVRLFLAGNISLMLNALARGSTMFIMSWYFQSVLENSPLMAGLKLIPMIGAMVLLSPISGRLSDRFGSRWLSTIGLSIALVAQLWLTTFPVTVSYTLLGIALALLGIGNGLFNAPNTNAVMGAVRANRRGVAAGTRMLLNNTGQTMAIAVAMVTLSMVMSHDVLDGLFTGVETAGHTVDGDAFMRGFHFVFVFSAVTSIIAIICSSLRGSEQGPGGRVAVTEAAEEALLARGATAAIQPTGRVG